MAKYAEAPPCDKGDFTCLHKLAASVHGDGLPYFCPGCTQRHMSALEWITGDELPWDVSWPQDAELPG